VKQYLTADVDNTPFLMLPYVKCIAGWSVINSLLISIALMIEAARTSETLVNFYQTTRRYIPEDSHLRTHNRENLKS
jgi:hypothetical protein